MPKFKVELQAVVTATVYVECPDEHEAKSIAENAWQPRLDGACIDPTAGAVYSSDVNTYAAVDAVSVEQV